MAQEIGLRAICGAIGLVLVFGLQTLLHAEPELPMRVVSISLGLVAAATASPEEPAEPAPNATKSAPVGPPAPIAQPITQAVESFQPPAAPLRTPDALPSSGNPVQALATESDMAEARSGLLLRVLIDSKKIVQQVKVVRGVGNPFLEDALAREMVGKPLSTNETLAEGESAWVEIIVAMKGAGLVP